MYKDLLMLAKKAPLLIGLFILANLFVGATAFANEPTSAETTTVADVAAQQTAADTNVLSKPSETKPVLRNPNAALVAMAFKFNRIHNSPNTYTEVVNNYCKKAKAGDADALFSLAWMYENGKGVVADKSMAAHLYNKAAEQGHSSAKESLERFTDVQAATTPLSCLLPDPPAPVAVITDNNDTNEFKPISDKTAALFYSQRSILKIVKKLAPKYKIDENLVMAFIAVESNFDAQATSPKNAQGLMQLIPETAERFGVKDAYKAEENIKGGLSYLRWLLAYYKGDIELVAAAYNAGEGTVDKYKGVPPYPETRLYVKKIANLYNNLTHPYQDNFVKGSIVDSFPKKKVM